MKLRVMAGYPMFVLALIVRDIKTIGNIPDYQIPFSESTFF